MKEDFKKFVKANPKLINYVKEKNSSWQDLYEIYALYGEDEKIWEKYIIDSSKGVDELIKMIKKVNLESVKNTIDSLQKAISILQSLNTNNPNDYEQYVANTKYEDLDD